jgi:hypothetical protein
MPIVAKGSQQYVRQQVGGQGVNPRPPYASGTVHHDAVADDGSVVHHHQVFESGQLVEWARDDEPGPWALVRRGDPFTPFTTELPGLEQVRAAHVRLGDGTVDLPPLDDLYSPRWDELPMIPHATAWLRYELTGTPVGPIACDIRYQDGKRPVSVVIDDWAPPADGEVAHGAPEMHIAMTFRNYLKMRTGELTALEAIEDGGTVDARWTLLLMLHGLLQEPEYIGIYRDLPVFPDELGWWGEVAPWIPQRDSFD